MRPSGTAIEQKARELRADIGFPPETALSFKQCRDGVSLSTYPFTPGPSPHEHVLGLVHREEYYLDFDVPLLNCARQLNPLMFAACEYQERQCGDEALQSARGRKAPSSASARPSVPVQLRSPSQSFAKDWMIISNQYSQSLFPSSILSPPGSADSRSLSGNRLITYFAPSIASAPEIPFNPNRRSVGHGGLLGV